MRAGSGSTWDPRPLLVGECNPYDLLRADPRLDLYPLPPRSAGARLARILGLSPHEYLRRFARVNLCRGEWSALLARDQARELVWSAQEHGGRPFILLGARVSAAFRCAFQPFGTAAVTADLFSTVEVFMLPHPSGRSRLWNEEGSQERARLLLARFLA